MPTSYPLDTTGLSPGNLILDEIHTLTEINAAPYRILVPVFAPFYLDNLVLKHQDAIGTIITLIPDVDYYVALPYVGASRSIGKMVYGGITINDALIEGTLLLSYQTIGGDWVADASYVRERLIEYIYNPRTTIWDLVTNKPNQFPPTNHPQPSDSIFGQQDLIAALDRIVAQIADQSTTAPSNNSMSAALHPSRMDNPHNTTKQQIGLGDVENFAVATPAEVTARALVDKYVLLNQVVSLIESVTFTKNDIGLGNVDNTSDAAKPVSLAQASTISFAHDDAVSIAATDATSKANAAVATAAADATNKANVAEMSARNASAPIAHVGATGNAHGLVTTSVAGFMSPTDKSKLDSLSVGGGGGGGGPATSLATPRNISMSGDGSWSVSFDGSADVSAVFSLANTIVTAGSYAKVTVNAKGLVTAGGALTAGDIPNLDAGKITSGTLSVGTTGNAATATKLATPRTINGVSFDGSSNIIIPSSGDETVFITNTNTTAVDKGYYVIKTTCDVELPLNPVVGFKVTGIQFQVSGSRLLRNGSLIMGVADDLDLDLYSSGVSLKFVGNTIGWLISV